MNWKEDHTIGLFLTSTEVQGVSDLREFLTVRHLPEVVSLRPGPSNDFKRWSVGGLSDACNTRTDSLHLETEA